MPKILDSKIIIPKITIPVDANEKENVERVIRTWGNNIPIVQVGDYVITPEDLKSMDIHITFNSLPYFSFVVDDANYQLRKELKKDIDKCIVFLGYRDWAIRFNGLLTNTNSEVGDSLLTLNGIIYFENLYTAEQKCYSGTVKSILKDICEQCNLGLYIFDNDYLNLEVDKFLNPHRKRIEIIDDLIRNKSRNNIYSYDPFGYLHIGNIESIRNSEVSKYTLKPFTGEQIQPADMFLTSARRKIDGDESLSKYTKIPIEYYTINTNLSELVVETEKTYSVIFENDSEDIIEDDKGINLICDDMCNQFSGFKNYDFPFYNDLVNKDMKGNSIKVTMEHLLFELLPFDVVNFECYLPETGDKGPQLDEEHSGKKVVLSYDIIYEKHVGEFDKIMQLINLI
jgi:hypothetical protein